MRSLRNKDEEMNTYKQHSEHQQAQISSMMAENESTLKINNALLHKTKLLEGEIRELRSKSSNILAENDPPKNEGEDLSPVKDKENKPQEEEQEDIIETLDEDDDKDKSEEETPCNEDPIKPEKEGEPTPDCSIEVEQLKIEALNHKKTINRLSNKIKELEILSEAEKDGDLLSTKNKQITELERKVAALDVEIEEKDVKVKELEECLSDIQAKHDQTAKEKTSLQTTHTETVERDEEKIKELSQEVESLQKSLDTKESLHQTFQDKIQSLLTNKQELIDKLEVVEKREAEMSEMIEQSKSNVSKKDNMYAKMLKLKEKKIQKLIAESEKLHNAEKSRAQSIDYFKKRIQVLEKSTKE